MSQPGQAGTCRRWLAACLAFSLATGCAGQRPYVVRGPASQIERGQPLPPLDFLASVLALPWKLLFLEWRYGNHAISDRTEQVLVRYLTDRSDHLGHVQIRLNQYAPLGDLKRLATNRHVAWPYRIFPGLLVTLVYEVVLPGRVFGGWLYSDYYNPWTDTLHLFSDHPAIGLHELGHAYDSSQQPYRGTYAFARMFPVFTLHQEWLATDEAISYLVETGDRRNELRAYKVLYPAYGSYMGNYLIPVPFAFVPGVVVGHIAGRSKAAGRARFYREVDTRWKTHGTTP